MLERAAGEMESVLRGEDALARVGGDEFVALLPASGRRRRRRRRPAWSTRSRPSPPAFPGAAHVSATTAWSSYPDDGDTLDALMNAADAVLLERKRARPSAR